MFAGTITDIFCLHGKGIAVAIQDLDGLPVVEDTFELAGYQCRIIETDKVRTHACLTGQPLPWESDIVVLIQDCGLSRDEMVSAHGLRVSSAPSASALSREE